MPRRNRALTIMVIPSAIFLWLVGWCLYWIGSSKKESCRRKAEPLDQTELTFIVQMPDQQQMETINRRHDRTTERH